MGGGCSGVHCSLTIVESGGPEACQRELQNLEIWPAQLGGGDVLAGTCRDLRDQGTGVLRALALVEKMGGSLTFVLKVVAILRRKRRKVSCCVLVPFACCINPRGC